MPPFATPERTISRSLGICLGMQMAVVEFARHVAGIEDAHSSELSDTENPVIDLMPEQRDVTDKGGTMRLGAYPCKITSENTFTYQAYREPVIYERHRHRYEFNNEYRDILQETGTDAGRTQPQREAGGDRRASGCSHGL